VGTDKKISSSFQPNTCPSKRKYPKNIGVFMTVRLPIGEKMNSHVISSSADR
jgi:hypothetical protein